MGDLVCTRIEDVLVRGYAREDGDTWGALVVGVLESTFDFVTHYEKGAGLTTTLQDGPTGDEPARGLYRTRRPTLTFQTLGKLHAEHEKRKPKLVAKLGAPLPAPRDLEAFAAAMDRGVARELGLG